MPGHSNRNQALLEFDEGLSAAQLAQETAKLDGMSADERMILSLLLFGRWGEVDASAAMAFSTTMGVAGEFVRPTILQSWSSVDPAGAAQYYAANSRELSTMGILNADRTGLTLSGQGGVFIIASEWARQDPTAAMAWATSLASGEGGARTSVLSEIAKTDPRQATEMMKQLDPSDQADAYNSIASRYGAFDLAAAQSWIQTLPVDDQAAALDSAIGGLSDRGPVAAIQQVALMAEDKDKNRVVGNMIANLARIDPQIAADFLSKQQSENTQRDCMRDLMGTWTNQNPVAALKYAQSLPQGEVCDSAPGAYVWGNNTTSPRDLVANASEIVNEQNRNRAESMAYMKWMSEDRAAATQALDASNPPKDEKEHILGETQEAR
jgi:hypothetical protein